MLPTSLFPLICFGGCAEVPPPELPLVYVDRDDFTVTASCRLVLDTSSSMLEDINLDGLIRVVGHNIEVDASQLVLQGDGGIGVRILSDGVRWHGGTLKGFSIGVQTSGSDVKLTNFKSQSCETGVRITGERFSGSNLHCTDGIVGLEAIGSNGGRLEHSIVSRMGQSGLHLDQTNEWKIHANEFQSIYGDPQAAAIKLSRSGRDHSIRGNILTQTEYGISVDTGDVNLGREMAQDAKERGLTWPPPEEEIALFKGKGFQDILFTENTIRNHRGEAFWMRGVSGLRLFGNQCLGPGPGLTLQFVEDFQFSQNLTQSTRPHAMLIQDCGVNRMNASQFTGDRQGLVVINPTNVDQWPPWAWAHLRRAECSVTDCTYEGFEVALNIGDGQGAVRLGGNQFASCDRSLQTTGSADVSVASGDPEVTVPEELDTAKPTPERPNENAWLVRNGKPWNESDPILRLGTVAPGFVQFIPEGSTEDPEFIFEGEAELVVNPNQDRITVRAVEKDRFERWRLKADGQDFSGVLTRGWWKGFMWEYEADPVNEYEQWRSEADSGWIFQCREPDLDFGRNAPGELAGIFPVIRDAGLPRDGFGLVCETERWVPAGKWVLRVEANDGVRVQMDGTTVIDAWERPTQSIFTHEFHLQEESVRRFSVQWYERTGLAYLRVTITPQSE